jgi:hypothetical protein
MKGKATWLVAAALLAASAADASAPAVQWSITLPNAAKGTSVCLSPDGGYVVTGTTPIGDAVKGNVYLAKVDELGSLQWEYGYGGPGQDVGLHVEPTVDGGYVVSGWTTNPEEGALLLKTDQDGHLIWQRTFDGPEPLDGNSVVTTPTAAGYFVICDAEEDYQALVIRTDAAGLEIHRRVMVNSLSSRTAKDGVLSSNGGCFIVGWTDSCGGQSTSDSPYDVYCAEVGADGSTLQWQKVYGGPGDQMAYAVTTAADFGYALAGSTISQADGSRDCYLLRVSPQGDSLWSARYGGPDDDAAYAVCRTMEGGYALAGVTGEDGPAQPYVVRTDIVGNMLWEKVLGVGGNYSWASSIKQSRDGGYIIAGQRQSSVAALLLTKLLPETKR